MDLSHYIGQKAVKRPVKALIDVAKRPLPIVTSYSVVWPSGNGERNTEVIIVALLGSLGDTALGLKMD